MSATATGEGATEVAVAGQLTIPPTITTISSTSEAVPINAARSPCRATGTRAATEPVGMTPALYHLIRCNPVDTRPRRRSPARQARYGRTRYCATADVSVLVGSWLSRRG